MGDVAKETAGGNSAGSQGGVLGQIIGARQKIGEFQASLGINTPLSRAYLNNEQQKKTQKIIDKIKQGAPTHTSQDTDAPTGANSPANKYKLWTGNDFPGYGFRVAGMKAPQNPFDFNLEKAIANRYAPPSAGAITSAQNQAGIGGWVNPMTGMTVGTQAPTATGNLGQSLLAISKALGMKEKPLVKFLRMTMEK